MGVVILSLKSSKKSWHLCEGKTWLMAMRQLFTIAGESIKREGRLLPTAGEFNTTNAGAL